MDTSLCVQAKLLIHRLITAIWPETIDNQISRPFLKESCPFKRATLRKDLAIAVSVRRGSNLYLRVQGPMHLCSIIGLCLDCVKAGGSKTKEEGHQLVGGIP